MTEIKNALRDAKMELKAATRDLEALRDMKSALGLKKEQVSLSLSGQIIQAREREKEKQLRLCATEQEKELVLIENELSELRKEQTKLVDHYSIDNIRRSIMARSPLDDNMQKLIVELKEEACDTISERFVDTYFTVLGKRRVSEVDFLDALDKIQNIRDQFIIQRDSKINMFIESMIERFNDYDTEPEESSSGTVMGIGIVMIVLSFVVFPFYSIALAVTIYLNLRKAYFMKQSLDLLKVVEDNLLLMEEALESRVSDEYNKKLQEIESEFGEAISKVQEEVDEKMQEISGLRQKTLAEFTFDDSKVRASVEQSIREIEHNIAQQSASEENLLSRISDIKKQIESLELQYKEAKDNMLSEYINFSRVGSSKFFPERFLLTDTEPFQFFEKAKFSNFFIYSDKPTMQDFIKLALLQIRTRMLPNTCYTQIWDSTFSGSAFMAFSSPDPKNQAASLFSILNTSKSIKEEVEVMSAIFQKRIVLMLQQGKDITEFNNDRIKQKSVTENYHLLLVMSPELLLNDEYFSRLLISGPELGIYTYIFVDDSKLDEKYIPMIESTKFVMLMKNGKVVPNAQTAVIESIKGKKKK